MTYSPDFHSNLIQPEFMIPGVEKQLKLIGPNAEWAYIKVTTHEFDAVVPSKQGKVNEDEGEASTRKGKAQPTNKDNTTAKDADADQASTRKGNFQPEPENTPN